MPRPPPLPALKYHSRGQSLENVSGLLESRGPAIQGIGRWFDGYSLAIDPDGNCYGTSWMLIVLLWAVQSPARLDIFVRELEDAGRPCGAFVGLDRTCKVKSATPPLCNSTIAYTW